MGTLDGLILDTGDGNNPNPGEDRRQGRHSLTFSWHQPGFGTVVPHRLPPPHGRLFVNGADFTQQLRHICIIQRVSALNIQPAK